MTCLLALALAVAPYLDQVAALRLVTPAAGSVAAGVVDDPTAVGVGADLDAGRVAIGQAGARPVLGRNLRALLDAR